MPIWTDGFPRHELLVLALVCAVFAAALRIWRPAHQRALRLTWALLNLALLAQLLAWLLSANGQALPAQILRNTVLLLLVWAALQVAILLSEPGADFEGGEFVLTEQRPRMQSRASVVPLRRGDGVVFAVNQRPVQGSRGFYRTVLRHGVSKIRSGRRHTVGIIFHDAA